LSDAFPIHNSLEQGDALSPLLFSRKQRETGIEWYTLVLVYVVDVDLLGENVNIIK
jgi:hypothetical protein